MKERRISLLGPVVAAVLLGGLAVAFSLYFRSATLTVASSALASDESVEVGRGPLGITFTPKSGPAALGFAFYPGARVPPEAYAYLGRAVAKAGYRAVILSVPLNFAVFSPGKAGEAIKAYPEVKAWVLGGHSLGGAMAASYCASRPPKVVGLVLLASYPGGGTDLSASGLQVLSVSASNDGLATPAKVNAARHLLPSDSRHVEVAGGNHAQFGEYGPQSGDGTATVPAELERRAVTEETLALMDRILAGLR
jgi:hypothetical protein